MKRKQWQRRLLCCFLAVAVLLGGLLCCLPVRAGAIVPLGLVQSALASFVTSAGYKMWSDNGGGDLMVAALSSLYDSWLESTDPVGALTLGQMSENDYVYLDNSGQIVIRKAAADMFQQFSDWIQSEYSVTVGSENPTWVLPSSSGLTLGSSSVTVYDVSSVSFSGDQFPAGFAPESYFVATDFSGSYPIAGSNTYRTGELLNGGPYFLLFNQSSNDFGLTATQAGLSSWLGTLRSPYWFFFCRRPAYNSARPDAIYIAYYAASTNRWLMNSAWVLPQVFDSSGSSGVVGLGVTLAQAVTDVVGQATDDDAVVIGVGAGVGATAQDIADLVAQGVEARTLDPSVSITAEAVIDTPVQPYPDIDGLGLPTLGAALVSRFPFCVPWDFVDTLKILNADPIPPVFDVTLVPASVAARWGVSGNYTIHVDLTSQEYAKLFVALRWGTLVGFCLGLALLTKRLIWTA